MDPWVQHAPLPSTPAQPAGYPTFPDSMLLVPTLDGTQLYLVNPYGNSESAVYDIASDAWSLTGWTFPWQTNSQAWAYYGSDVYLMGYSADAASLVVVRLDLATGTPTVVGSIARDDALFTDHGEGNGDINYPGGMAVIGTKLYVADYYGVIVYDVATDTWSWLDWMTPGVQHSDGAFVGDGSNLYWVSGYIDNFVSGEYTSPGTDANVIEKWDGATWTQTAAFSEGPGIDWGVEDCNAAYWDGNIYLLGGDLYTVNWDDDTPQSSVWIYNIAGDFWSLGEPMSDGLSDPCCVAAEGVLWRLGGWFDTGPDSRVLESSALGAVTNSLRMKESINGSPVSVSTVVLSGHNLLSSMRDPLLLTIAYGATSYERWLRLTWPLAVSDVTVRLVHPAGDGVTITARVEPSFTTPVGSVAVQPVLTPAPRAVSQADSKTSDWLVLQADVLPQTNVGTLDLQLEVGWTDASDSSTRTQVVPLELLLSYGLSVAPPADPQTRPGFRRRFHA